MDHKYDLPGASRCQKSVEMRVVFGVHLNHISCRSGAWQHVTHVSSLCGDGGDGLSGETGGQIVSEPRVPRVASTVRRSTILFVVAASLPLSLLPCLVVAAFCLRLRSSLSFHLGPMMGWCLVAQLMWKWRAFTLPLQPRPQKLKRCPAPLEMSETALFPVRVSTDLFGHFFVLWFT